MLHPDLIVVPVATVELGGVEADVVFDDWVAACEDAQDAYEAWRSAAPEQRRDAYAVYVAATDREAAAAAAFATAVA